MTEALKLPAGPLATIHPAVRLTNICQTSKLSCQIQSNGLKQVSITITLVICCLSRKGYRVEMIQSYIHEICKNRDGLKTYAYIPIVVNQMQLKFV